MFQGCGIESHNLCSVSPLVAISDPRLLNFLFMDWENAVTVFKGIALFEFKRWKWVLLTRTSFSVCFHIPRVFFFKKGREKKRKGNWVLWYVWTTGPWQGAAAECGISDRAAGDLQEGVPWDAFCTVCAWQGWERCFPWGELPFAASLPVLRCCGAASHVGVPGQFPEAAIPSPCAGLWDHQPGLGQICEETPETCILILGVASFALLHPQNVNSWSFELVWAFQLKTSPSGVQNSIECGEISSQICALEVIKPRGCLLPKTPGQENKQLGAHLERGCLGSRQGKYWNLS